MVEAAQYWDGAHHANRDRVVCGFASGERYPLCQALVRTDVVEVLDVLAEDAPQVGLAQDQHVIQALSPHAAENRSQVAFCLGARYAVRSSVMAVVAWS